MSNFERKQKIVALRQQLGWAKMRLKGSIEAAEKLDDPMGELAREIRTLGATVTKIESIERKIADRYGAPEPHSVSPAPQYR